MRSAVYQYAELIKTISKNKTKLIWTTAITDCGLIFDQEGNFELHIPLLFGLDSQKQADLIVWNIGAGILHSKELWNRCKEHVNFNTYRFVARQIGENALRIYPGIAKDLLRINLDLLELLPEQFREIHEEIYCKPSDNPIINRLKSGDTQEDIFDICKELSQESDQTNSDQQEEIKKYLEVSQVGMLAGASNDNPNLQSRYVPDVFDRSYFNDKVNKFCYYPNEKFVRYMSNTPMYDAEPTLKPRFKILQEQVNTTAQYMVDLFNTQKSALNWSDYLSDSGLEISENDLWKYKFEDRIYTNESQKHEHQNHAIVVLVDFSSSMFGGLLFETVLRQVFVLMRFCRILNIPFKILAFTTARYSDNLHCWEYLTIADEARQNHLLNPEKDTIIMELFSSEMSEEDIEQSMINCSLLFMSASKQLAMNGSNWSNIPVGTTPLFTSLMFTTSVIEELQARTGCKKVGLFVFSDGEADPLSCFQIFSTTTFDDMNVEGFENLLLETEKHIQTPAELHIGTFYCYPTTLHYTEPDEEEVMKNNRSMKKLTNNIYIHKLLGTEGILDKENAYEYESMVVNTSMKQLAQSFLTDFF